MKTPQLSPSSRDIKINPFISEFKTRVFEEGREKYIYRETCWWGPGELQGQYELMKWRKICIDPNTQIHPWIIPSIHNLCVTLYTVVQYNIGNGKEYIYLTGWDRQ